MPSHRTASGEPRRTFLKECALAASALALPDPLRAQSGVRWVRNLLEPAQHGPSLPIVRNVDLQPLIAQVNRVVAAMDYLGAPLSAADRQMLDAAFRLGNARAAEAGESIQQVLDRSCLAGVNINPESRAKVVRGPATPELVQHGWRQVLVKVHNEAGTTAALRGTSPQALPLPGSTQDEIDDRWLDLMMFDRQPLTDTLSGLALEYRIVQLYSRDAGNRDAALGFNVGQGTQDIGFRNEVAILFRCQPSQSVRWRVRDEAGAATMAAFIVRDAQGRIYPSRDKRLAPDFSFQPQVYRADGESLILPAGDYTVEFWRGPESTTKKQPLTVTESRVRGTTSNATGAQEASFQIERWIDPSKLGWWSGDHHIHAAGCAHYTKPTEGVRPEDMVRHTLGEDLKVGSTLTWGPGFDYQKQFFTGQDDKVSKAPYLLHYDVEVSGFGSHQSGHLVLLRLKEQIYPGGDSSKHWPTLGLNTLRWAKRQGAVCGPAHSGWGLEVDTTELPNYIVPPYKSIGANEYIVDVTHEVPAPNGTPVPAVDFMSTVDTPYVWELNMWYHTLNVGFRTRISGETDWPCIYGDRVGLGRSYVKMDGRLTYAEWCEGIRNGRNYVGDGKSHLIDFRVNDVPMGERGSEVRLPRPGIVRARVRAAAMLNKTPDAALRSRRFDQQPYWDIERARIGESREVAVELIVNGYPVAKQTLVADGTIRDLTLEAKIERSSWVALRILPSSHTNPVWVLVGGRPVRASRRSADWCLKGVDQCWSQKERTISAAEMGQARADYEHARRTYRRILSETDVD
jgi:hypothetical protein